VTQGRDGKLDRTDGLMLIGLCLFWQCFQVFDVLKHNVRHLADGCAQSLEHDTNKDCGNRAAQASWFLK